MKRLSLPLRTLVMTGVIFVISACSTFDDVEEVRLVDLLDGIEGPDMGGDADIDSIHTDVILDEVGGVDGAGEVDEVESDVDATELADDVDATSTDATPCLPRASVDVTCDNQDDDCDGQVDEDYVPTATCGLGVCLATSSSSTCVDGVETPCIPGAAQSGSDARCNGIDEDCDGFVDENGRSACGVGQVCNQGQCACPGTATQCGGECVNLLTDPTNCGVCGTACSGSQVCNQGHCGTTCNTWLEDCNGACVKLDEAPDHCGACGVSCALPHSDASCFGGQCVIGACLLGYGDADGAASNGCECAQTNGGVELCDGVDQDCDGVVDNAATASLASSALHCGACDAPCPAGAPTEFATCSGGLCGFENCPAGWWDGDDDPTNGCEYACTQTEGGVEICDGVDNDCDGEVDEEFDLQRDAENCGACGVSCASLGGNAVWDCSLGECDIDQCEPQYFDINNDLSDGCEYYNANAGEIWVDVWNGDDNYAGSQAFPLKTIARALEMASEFDTIRIQPGTYLEELSITTPNILLVGNGVLPTEVTVHNQAATTTVSIGANAVLLRNLGISGGTRGVVIANCDGCELQDCNVSSVSATSAEAIGVELVTSTNLALRGTTISAVSSSSTSGNGEKPNAIGLSAQQVDVLTIGSCVVEDIKGADVAVQIDGGNATGMVFSTVTNALVNTTRIEQISGGKGGDGTTYNCATGGRAIGVHLRSNSTGNVFQGNTMSEIIGGVGGGACGSGPGWAGPTNIGVGIFLGGNFDNVIESSNRLNGQPLLYSFGPLDVTFQDHVIAYANAIPFEIGAIIAIGASSLAVTNNTLTAFSGVPGASVRSSSGFGRDGIDFAAIFVDSVLGECTLSNNTISNGIGGRGGHVEFNTAGRGGRITALDVRSSGCQVLENTISDLLGGEGGNTAPASTPGFGGAGGSAVAVNGDSDGLIVSGNTISSVEGGRGGDSWSKSSQYGHGGNGGAAYGISVGSTGARISSTVVERIKGGRRGLGLNHVSALDGDLGNGFGVGVTPGSVNAQISGSTFSQIGDTTGSSAVFAHLGAVSVLVKDTVAVSSTGTCVASDLGNFANVLAFKNTLLTGCVLGASSNSTDLGSNLINQDPLFVDPTSGDFHLICNSTQCSPAVDAGDPASDYSLEPSPNGCRVNMGAYGNTAEAASDPNATHCP